MVAMENQDMARWIKAAVKRNKLSYVWLIDRLAERRIITDKSEVSAVLAMKRFGPKANVIISASYQILRMYEERMG